MMPRSPAATCTPPPEGPPPPATGPAVMGGTIEGRNDPSFILVARGEGETQLLFYGPDLASTSSVTGFVVAGGSGCSGSDTTTYNGLDRSRRSSDPVYLRTTMAPSAPSLSGTIRYANATYKLAGGPMPGSTYSAAAPPKVADVVGTWTMTNLLGASTSLSVDTSGTVTGADQGCPLTGMVTPGQEGLNLLRLQLDVSWCSSRPSIEGATYDGFALASPLSGGGTQLLIWSEANNGVDWDYVMAIGRR